MMRSGTTLIQRLLARDARFYCVFGWEIAETAPRPGTSWDQPDTGGPLDYHSWRHRGWKRASACRGTILVPC
jgi:hypothetical protein